VADAAYDLHFALVADGRAWIRIDTDGSGEQLMVAATDLIETLARVSCVVSDSSGTPLNLRRTPQSRGEIVATLANGSTITGVRGSSSWIHVERAAGGWAHNSGLQCTELQQGALSER
jgi:SH3-like domain-containing protein